MYYIIKFDYILYAVHSQRIHSFLQTWLVAWCSVLDIQILEALRKTMRNEKAKEQATFQGSTNRNQLSAMEFGEKTIWLTNDMDTAWSGGILISRTNNIQLYKF